MRFNLFLCQRNSEVEGILFDADDTFLLAFSFLFYQFYLKFTRKSCVLFDYLALWSNLVFDSFELLLKELLCLLLILADLAEEDVWLSIVFYILYCRNCSEFTLIIF